MAITLRRVVTGHDGNGHACVLFDDRLESPPSTRPGHASRVVWSSADAVPSNDGAADTSATKLPTSLEQGSIFRIVEYSPGVVPRNHRTNSLDYAVVLSGSIDMELDDGVTVSLHAGDVLVQRGTIHNWVNRGSEPCRIAFVLIGAQPVSAGGHALEAKG
jgi:quercetin dioxygenase-like cupin family protein